MNDNVKLNEFENTVDPIRHVVLLMMENHSFDQMLGSFQAIYPDVEGINSNIQRFNLDINGNRYLQKECKLTQVALDPNHDTLNVLNQLQNSKHHISCMNLICL